MRWLGVLAVMAACAGGAEEVPPGETDAVADRHVHPAEPRTIRLTLRIPLSPS